MASFDLTQAAALITALGVVLGAVALFYKFARRVENAIGEDKQGRSISERIGRVEHQVFPNGGSSLSDQVRDVDNKVTGLSGEVKLMREMFTVFLESQGHPVPAEKTTVSRSRGRSRQQ